MSPAKTIKEIGDTASPWAVLAMLVYLTVYNPTAGAARQDGKAIAEAIAESSIVDIAVIQEQMAQQTRLLTGMSTEAKELSKKIDPLVLDIQALKLRVAALEEIRGRLETKP